jgi:MraZ protein
LRTGICAPLEGCSFFVSALVVYAGSGLSSVDGKGRTTIPAELRDTVAESSAENSVCLARHPTLPCLIGFGRAERAKLRADVEAQWQSAVQRGAEFDRELAGINASSIFETTFESSGRFVIPPIHRFFGKLEDKAFFFGATTHFMLWNPDIFKATEVPGFTQVREELEFWLSDNGRRGK